VEYKKEGFEMFQRLIKEINKQIAFTIFHITVNPPAGGQPTPQMNLVTNLSDASAKGSSGTTSTKVGRNAPCPCGSGKKYKKCHGKNI
jgi:preprotein translocase subunit SecA